MDQITTFEAVADFCAPDYKDSGIALIDNLRTVKEASGTTSLSDAALLMFVRAGVMKIRINGRDYEVTNRHIIFCRLGHKIGAMEFSDNFVGHGVLISVRYGQKIMAVAGNIWNYIAQIDSDPVILLPERTSIAMRAYYHLLKTEAENRSNLYYTEVVSSIVTSMLCSLISDIRQSRFSPENAPAAVKTADVSPQALALFNRFMDILNHERCTERKIEYYASRLCVTPKYLSTVCKRLSDRTAHQWIAYAIVNGINGYLKYSDKSVKEIAVMYGFPNLSFFSKYVKKHLGTPPTKSRR